MKDQQHTHSYYNKSLFTGENTELSSRLQTVRQKVIELEKNLANVTASSEKYSEVRTSFVSNMLFMEICTVMLLMRSISPYTGTL